MLFASVKQAWNMGAAAIGATIYFGSAESTRQITEISECFQAAHELGMTTILWCYLRNSEFNMDKDYHLSSDLTGQANHLGTTIQADIIYKRCRSATAVTQLFIPMTWLIINLFKPGGYKQKTKIVKRILI